ncbi:hypothetical protein JRQ81_016634 [Phrynocephalus forsythii]|uniref:Cadherin domain-containing protein n=1 Tax=Phrynocephalus forsythii TaxID=171643 RepID=A0A9Q0XSM3_9SAUR|nr:hypothetical protein JRQ81_016634 [Phrynocephalus forsythii]
MENQPLPLRAGRGRRRRERAVAAPGSAGRWLLLPLWLCLCGAGRCSGQVYNLSLAVDEGLPADTLVGDISAGLPPGEAHPGGFFLSEGNGESAVLADFHVHTDTGIIRTARPLDRERRARYSFVAATLRGEMVQVEIAVVDVNDHAPRFPRDSVCLNISELSPPGSAFRLPAARDPDSGRLSIQGYSLLPWDPKRPADGDQQEEGDDDGPSFQLRYWVPQETLDLILLRRLDRERAETHRLLVEAWDGGSPRRSGRLRVEIQVLDENDNAPAFGQSEYRARVREDAPAGSSLCRLLATDPDRGANGEVRYSLSRRQGDPSAASYFEVDGAQRAAPLAPAAGPRGARPPPPDRRGPRRRRPARGGHGPGGGGGARRERQRARHPPALPHRGRRQRLRGRPPGSLRGPSVRLGPGRRGGGGGGGRRGPGRRRRRRGVALSLQGGDGAFSLRPSGGGGGVYFLCVEGPLDRESRESYELLLVAVDSGDPPLSSQRALLLRVADLNDQAPVFAQPRYRAAVSEAASPGTVVLRLSASDADEAGSRNAQVRYALEDGQAPHGGALFSLDPLSGVLSTRAGLDREREAAWQLRVLAWDLGEPPLSAACLVSITVEDANDNEPVFQQAFYNASVAEHARPGHCFLQVKATDKDSGHFGHIEYSLYDGFHNHEKSKAFQVDLSSGCIWVSQDIDREEDPSTYDLLVKATDGGGLSAQAFVRIQIEDINDNHPVFHPVTYMTSISSHTQPGTEIINVIATDKDSGIYGVVTYELVPGQFSSLFTVDTSTGIVYLISSLSNVEHSNVQLTVSAQDGGGLWSTINAVVTIGIVPSVVAPAVFERSRYSFSIPEDALEGSAVGTVRVREPLNFLETITYRISSGDPHGRFSIDHQYGIIRINKQLDHEAHSHIVLTVQSQLGSSPVYSSAQVNVTVIDVNDNPPTFMVEMDHVNISQSTVPGTALYIAHAEDKDSGLNGAIRYAIVSNQTMAFTLDPVLGVLYLSRPLAVGEHIIYITAEDLGSPPLSSLLMLRVIIDEQKVHPVLTFENLVYQVEISEISSIGAIILQVQARKLDLHHDSGEVVYFLEQNRDSASFQIDSGTGVIYLRGLLDYEHTPVHSFRAFVTSPLDKVRQNASTSVIVNVIDENDNSPVFLHQDYFFEIEESSQPQGVIGAITAVDKDSGRNGQLSYFLLSDGNYFKINSNTGEIINWVALDYEQEAYHPLIVMVTDHGVPQRNATVTAYISVTDLNDNHPTFSQSPLHVKVLEGQPEGTLVATIFANDLDSGKNGIVLYSLLSEENLGHFQIDSSSGELRTTETLLYNWHSTYRMVVTAADQGVPPLQTQMAVLVEVIPFPKERAFSSQNIRHFVIPETFRPAQMLGSLKVPGLHPGGKWHFSISEEDSGIPFEINSATGELFLIKELDYETAPHYFFRVVVNNDLNHASQNNTFFLSIKVEDQNDHSPFFQNDFIVIGIEENVPIGTLVYTFNARDEDGSFFNSHLEYFIHSNGENPFLIHPSHGSLITAVPLDRETTQYVILTVSAVDQPVNLTDRRQSSLAARIVILDVNDNSPCFVSTPVAYIREDAEVGSLVHQIVAQDPDQGWNGEVTYHLLASNEDHPFVIEKTTGLLTTAFPLDREYQEYYNLTVVAFDGGTPALSTTQSLTITLLDINDETPVFTKAVYEASICENKLPGEVVLKVGATDKDSGINSLLHYEILPGPGSELFEINSDTGEITTVISLDRENQEIHTLKVLVQDGGSPVLFSTASVVFQVLDENDNIPKFLLPIYEVQIMENQEPSRVATVLAVDKDKGHNGTVQYKIVGGNVQGYFALHKTSGDLFTTHRLDRETVSTFVLIVESSDLGDPPRSSVAQLQIKVLDDNDNSPVFALNQYQTTVREDLGEGSVVLELFATDADEGPNGKVVYSLLGDTSRTFTINRVTGAVTVLKPLDRERQSQYFLKAVATDSGTLGPRSTSVTITVHVNDVNDNWPVFLQNPLKAYVSSQTPINQTIASVQASDADLGLNGAVNFRFVTPETEFELDPNTDQHRGTITLVEALDFEESIRIELLISVSDSVHQITEQLLILISDVNDNPPVFTQDAYQVVIPELSSLDIPVITLCAKDRDSEDNGKLSYRILSPSDAFSIDSQNGSLFLVKPLISQDRNSFIKLHIEASDNGNPPLTTLASVVIQIQDVNNCAPQFTMAAYNLSIPEDASFGERLFTFSADDCDGTLQNSYVEYSIIGGNGSATFHVENCISGPESMDKMVGNLVLRNVLDRERSLSYQLLILASDRGKPPLNSTATVSITVLDINDNSPVFTSLEYHVHVRENFPIGSHITSVSARDCDAGSNADITYSLISGNDEGHFRLDEKTGSLDLVRALDYEENKQFSLTVQASDGGLSVKNVAFAIVFISILDTNDYAPIFVFPSLDCGVHENLPPFSPVCTVSALDFDTGPYGDLSYSMQSLCLSSQGTPGNQDMFFLDPLTGEVRTKHVLDFEQQSKYCFIAQAKDKSDLTATVTVQVSIEGTDEYDPIFSQDQYWFDFPEKNEPGQLIGKVTASDYDGGLDGAIQYTLLKQSPFFSVNFSSGAVYLTRSFHRKRSSLKRIGEDTLELFIKAHSPKLDSKSSTCKVLVNISNTPESYSMLTAHVVSISIAVCTVAFLMFAISFAVLIVRCRQKDTANSNMKHEMPSAANLNLDNENQSPKDDRKSQIHETPTLAVGSIAEWLSLVGVRDRRDMSHPCRNSDSSGHGSAEGETAEDEEIKRINEHPCRKGSGSALSDRASRIPDSGIPRDSDQLSYQSGETDVVAFTQNLEAVQCFKDESGEIEGKDSDKTFCNKMMSQTLEKLGMKEKDILTDLTREYIFIPEGHISHYGSLATLVDSDEDLRGSYNWDYLLNWEPRFKPLASVFGDIAELEDKSMKTHSFPREKKSFVFPPPLITSIAQPGLKTVPPRMPTLLPGQTFKKYPRSPLIPHLKYPSSAMTPSFSPSLSLLTRQTPTASPVPSHPSLKGVCSGRPACDLATDEVQV